MSIVLIVAVVGIVLFVIASLCMLHAAAKTPQNADTVIVLGAGLQGDQPSRTLAARLDAAAQYLQAHPTAVCIVTGGQGNNEAYTEASVMYTYLVSKGIDPSRLYREEKSTNTKENLSFAAAVIDSEGLDRRVVIATQEFHQYRAQALANQAGLEVAGPLTCRSETALLFCYWIREFAAIGRLWLLG